MANPEGGRLRVPLRSTVSRRIFGLFVACSLIPLGLLSVVSYAHISQALHADAAGRLGQACKTTGRKVLERIMILNQDVEGIRSKIQTLDNSAVIRAVGPNSDRVASEFSGIGLYSPQGRLVSWTGVPPEVPTLSALELRHLRDDKPLLLTRRSNSKWADILILRTCRTQSPGAEPPLLIAGLRGSRLWSGDGLLSLEADFVALDSASRVIYSTWPEIPGWASDRAEDSDGYAWYEQGGEYLAHTSKLSMQSELGTSWTLAYSQPKSEILTTLYGFRYTFGLFAVLTLLTVLLVSIRQIRQRLMPIQQLLSATERVSRQEFDCKVSIRTKDEFEKLGDAFNKMVDHLEGDLKARKFAESELIAARDKAMEAAQTEARFIANVSHELRTPMTSIRAFAEILKDHGAEDPETREEFLDIILTESDRLTRLIENVLDLTKIRSLEQPRLEVIDVSKTIIDVCMAMRVVAADRQITIDNRGVCAPLWVDGDRDCLKQVWTNLISNATRFSPDGGVVLVKAGLDNDHVVAEVTDQGPGISEKDQSIIFERFRQVTSDVVTDKPSGTGLGLTIAKDIVDLHRGVIEVNSSPGKGSTFRVRLPVSFHAVPPITMA